LKKLVFGVIMLMIHLPRLMNRKKVIHSCGVAKDMAQKEDVRCRRPLGVTVLAMAHFLAALLPLLWLLLINFGIVANPEGNSPPSGASMAGGVILIPLLLNGIVTVPVGYGLLKGFGIARWLGILGGLIAFLVGALLLASSEDLFWSPMIVYGAAVIYYLTRKHVEAYFGR
jgi:hypothetical protein